jgi:hypothetical protein
MLEQQEFLGRAAQAQAKVLRIEQRSTTTGTGSNRQTSTSDCAILEFTTASGETRGAEYTYGLLEASFEAGDTTLVHYSEQDPDTVLVDGFGPLWLGYLIMLGMGLVFVFAGGFGYWMMAPS